MNSKAKIKKKLNKEKEPFETPSTQIDLKHPIDMKMFWKQINQHHFTSNADKTAHDVNHLVNLFSQHDLTEDYVYAKASFPRSFAQFAGKALDPSIKKNNPLLITKLLGLYVYMDNSDWININSNINDSGCSEKIKDEIKVLEEKIEEIEQNNMNNLSKIKDIANHKENKIVPSYTIDYESDSLKLQRYDNLINQIFRLQMKQFAESISGIKKDSKTNRYIVLFDPSEHIEPLNLSEEDYTNLIGFRDPFNSISVHDFFQEKTFSYYNTSPSNQTIKKVKKKETIQIAKKIQIDYNYCHHCKQRKPGEVMLQCKSHLCEGKVPPRPHKTFVINNTTVVRKNKCLIVRHFDGDPKEYIESTEQSEVAKECKRFFCHFCLKGSYDAIVDEVKIKKDWVCPYCTGFCFCSRCTRHDKILKLIGLYVSFEGELNVLYDNLIMKNFILDRLNAHMLLSNLIVVINDPLSKPSQIIKNLVKTEVKSTDKVDNALTKCDTYKSNLTDIQSYYDKLFMQARIDKCLLLYDKSISNTVLDTDNDAMVLSKKRHRIEKNNVNDISKNYLNKGIIYNKIDFDANNDKEENKTNPAKIFGSNIIKKKRGRPRKYPL